MSSTFMIIRRPPQGLSAAPRPGQPGVHLNPAIRDGFVAEGTSTELLGQSADVGCRLPRAGGQR